ncbi:Protein nrde2 [Mactra antiquata]
MSGDSKPQQNRSVLFPSAQTDATTSYRNTGHDWLQNKSFTNETAKKFVEFQQELNQIQTENDPVTETDSFPDRNNSISAEKQESKTKSYFVSDFQHSKRQSHKDEYSEHHHKKKKRKKDYSSDSYTSDESDVETYKKKKKSKKHKKKKSHKRKEKEKKKQNEIPGLFESRHIFMDDIYDIAPEHAFKFDKVPDKNSWAYGSLYSGHVANYKSVCNQCIGGDKKNIVFMKEHSKKQKDKQISDRYFYKENRRIMKETAVGIISNDNSICKTGNLSSFIPIENVHDENSVDLNLDIRDKLMDESTALYVVGKGKNIEDTETENYTSNDPYRLKVIEFNKKLRESPNDIQLWLKFIEFQDKTTDDRLGMGIGSGDKISASGVYEKKVSILDKALEANPGNIDLLLAKIKLSAEVSDSVIVNKDMEDLLFVHSGNPKLWKYYLMFNQSRLSTLSVTKMTKLYHKCFNTLFGILEGRVLTARKCDTLEIDVIDIFLQYCYFLKQSGCKENAIASFQAMIEFNLFVPRDLKAASKELRLTAFEEFWDGNCARIGSKEALGWNKWVGSGKPENFASFNNDNLEDLEENVIELNLSKHLTWLKIENLRGNHHWFPWQPGQGQTIDDCEDENVDRLFLYDDIKSVLFVMSEEHHLKFVMSYLQFLGFRTEGNSNFSENLDNISCEHLNDVMCNIDRNSVCQNILSVHNRDTPREIAINTLNQLIPCFGDLERSNLTLTLIKIHLSKYTGNDLSKQDKKDMRKILKTILKDEHNRNDLNIWCSYVDLERSIGKTGEAQSIVETALMMYSGENIEHLVGISKGLISLYAQYCEMALGIDNGSPTKMLPKTQSVSMETKMKVVSILGILVDGKKFKTKDMELISGAAVLKVLAKLSNLCKMACEKVCSSNKSNSLDAIFRKLTWCCSLCMYCKGDVNSSLDIYSTMIGQISDTRGDNSKHLKLELSLDKLRLVLYYLSTASITLHVLRDSLDNILSKFPDNPVLLSLFVDVERRSRISGRLNRYFDRICRTEDSVIPTVYAVINQLAFKEMTGITDDYGKGLSGLIHRARSWIEHSLYRDNLTHSVLLWRIYIQLEKSAGDISRMKGVYYRALQQCPWAKIIYTDAIQLFGENELQEIVDLMTEKHLQVQLPVEELDILISPS